MENMGPEASAYALPWTGMWENRTKPQLRAYETAPGSLPSKDIVGDINRPATIGSTVAATPAAPSPQMWQGLEATGALPILQDYVENVLGTPWNTFRTQVESYWPTRTGVRQSPTYRTTAQK